MSITVMLASDVFLTVKVTVVASAAGFGATSRPNVLFTSFTPKAGSKFMRTIGCEVV